MAVIIKTFTTPGGQYVYDRETHSLLRAKSEQEFAAFQRVETGTATHEDWALLDKYVQEGYLKETCLEEIIHPETPFIEQYLETRMQQLTLQLGRSCNLRCSYCSYGGNYKNQRTHSEEVMSLDMIKKCVDFIMQRSRGVDEIAIGLYGGESLLHFDSVRECVKYVQEEYTGRKLHFTITTNGTILTDEIIQFLDKHQVNLSISLDGPKEVHDSNRVFENGEGSFDVIMNNVRYVKENYPEFFKRIYFMTTVAPGVDLFCINEFFTADDVLVDSNVRTSTVSSIGARGDVRFDDMYRLTNEYNRMKVFLAAIGMYSKDKTSKLYTPAIEVIKTFNDSLSKMNIYKHSHPGGPCLPGIQRPFVDVYGNIFPCERVSENSEVMKIGHIDTGFDMDKIKAMLNVGKLSEDECKACWCFSTCGLCVAFCDGGDSLSHEVRVKNCIGSMNSVYHDLKTVCLLKEHGYDFLNLK